MKHKVSYKKKDRTIEKVYSYIPLRFILAMLLIVLEVVAIIGMVILLCLRIRYFYFACLVTQVVCVITIIASDDNPEYKVPWLVLVILVPVIGFMLYFIFYSRKLRPGLIKRLMLLDQKCYRYDDSKVRESLKETDPSAASLAWMLEKTSGSKVFTDTALSYFPSGEALHEQLLKDLEGAGRFIYMEYFIIEEGFFWSSILDILKAKAAQGVEVKVLYDDIGCMMTLPGNYFMKLREMGIQAAPFSILKASANNEFNNRSHRKITVIDGTVGYTGGINIADEYINRVERFGHWKDVGIRLEGPAVMELSKLFSIDYCMNVLKMPEFSTSLYPALSEPGSKASGSEVQGSEAPGSDDPGSKDLGRSGYVIPFGDGPKPLYNHQVGESVIEHMLNTATDYVYMTSPYLIIDNDLCQCIENAALRGVDVRIIVPHIPDKKIVFAMTRSFYQRLMAEGVRIYEYTPGFIHAKTYVADGKCAMVGTINLDYRSLVHHFENGVYMYGSPCIADIKADIDATLSQSMEVTKSMLKTNIFQRILRKAVRIFAPLM